MDGLQGMSEQMSQMAQAAVSAGIEKKALEFQGSMVSALINGGADQSAEALRISGLAAQGIGNKLNITA